MKKIKINEGKIRSIVSESMKQMLLESINTPQELISLLGGNPTKAVFNTISILNFLNKNGVINGFDTEKIGNLIMLNNQQRLDNYRLPADNFDSETDDFGDDDEEYGGLGRL